jgi:hypothetical protein
MKIYQRKLHIEKNSADLDSAREIRKALNSSERQRGKREIEEQLPEFFFTYSREWNELNNPYPHEHWSDWQSWRPFTEYTIGGKFLTTLTRLGLLEDRTWDNRRNQNTWWLYELVSVAPDGYIYVSSSTDKEPCVMKLDTASTPKLQSILSK